MALEKYRAKRKFDQTPEPLGQKVTSEAKGNSRFVVQKHEARALHYDFRLECDGVLLSWAVPKGPSLNPEDKRLAMQTEDHPLDYADFEGVIPEGNYGAGTVMVWDRGTYWAMNDKWEEADAKQTRAALHKGHLTFLMQGEKLKGEFALIKLRNTDEPNAWLLIKANDQFASKADVTIQDRPVLSGQTMKQIGAAGAKQWTSGEIDLGDAPKAAFPRAPKPMLATLADSPFDDPGWLYEVKWDGYRIVSEVHKGKVKLLSRNGLDYTAKYPPAAEALSKLAQDAVLDGEMVVVDETGRSGFNLLQRYHETGRGDLVYYAFDLLYFDGRDLTGLSLERRKDILRRILPQSPSVKLSDHVTGQGKAFFEAARKQGLEGIMAKRADSHYVAGKRSRDWLKLKVHQRQEVVVGGFTEPRGSRRGVGSLLLGVYYDGKLVFVGHSGGAFGGRSPEELRQQLEKLEIPDCPFAEKPKSNSPQHWVKPVLVCEVEFTEWTPDGSMRHPNVDGWREDKTAKDVVKEVSADLTGESASNRRTAPQVRRQSTADEDEVSETKQGAGTSKLPKSGDALLDIAGKRFKVSHLDKVYWPGEGITKGDLINYYRSVKDLILPYLKDRPESMNRHPGGINGQSFYQKDVEHPPDWATTVDVFSESNDKHINYLVCNDEATLVYMANLGCIELNPWFSTTQHLDKPDYAVIDLDPEDIGFDAVVKTALGVREALDAAGIPSYPKTSGATGLHIFVPLGAKYDYDHAKQFAEIVAHIVNARLPDITSVLRMPAKRQKRVYLDFLQNRKGQTLACAYSVRPRPGAPVSTPLEWKEVNAKLDPSKYTLKSIHRRLDKVGDLWQPVLGKGIDLTKALQALGDHFNS